MQKRSSMHLSIKSLMKFFLVTAFLLLSHVSLCQTYSKVISDSEIVSFIDSDILNDSIKFTKSVERQMFSLYLDVFYYKDSSDFVKKNENSLFIFRYNVFRGKEYTNHLDSIFSRKDIDFFYKQIKGQTKISTWLQSFVNSTLVDNVELDSNRYAKQVMYSYSLPLFSFDRRRAIIIKGFYCGFLCGGGAYYIYERDNGNKWRLLRKINEWGE